MALQPSIESCFRLPFVLRCHDRQELCNALVKEYGSTHGTVLYRNLKAIFQGPDVPAEVPAEEPAEPEKKKSAGEKPRKRWGKKAAKRRTHEHKAGTLRCPALLRSFLITCPRSPVPAYPSPCPVRPG